MPYTVCVNINFILLTKFCALFLTNIIEPAGVQSNM